MEKQKTLFERHQAEINTMIANHHAALAHLRPIALWSPRKRDGSPMPKGWTLAKARTARAEIKKAHRGLTQQMRIVVQRQRAEANAR